MIPYSRSKSGRRDRTVGVTNPLSPEQRFYSITDLQELGLSYYKINKMVEQHLLSKMNNKMYENATYSGDDSNYAAAMAYALKGLHDVSSALVRPDELPSGCCRYSNTSEYEGINPSGLAAASPLVFSGKAL